MKPRLADPVRVEQRALLEAAPTAVWKVLSDIEAWTNWAPALSAASMSGPLLIGARFVFVGDRIKYRCVLREVHKPSRISWTMHGLGWSGRLDWEIEGDGDTGSRLTSTAEFDGWGLRWSRLAESWPRFHADWVYALRRRVHTEVPCE